MNFYDGSILHDFEKAQTLICDIDLYEKSPFINRMGCLWGSSHYMSPVVGSQTNWILAAQLNVYFGQL